MHQNFTVGEEKVFSLVAAEDDFVENRSNYSIRRPGLYPSSASVSYLEGTRRITIGKCLRSAWYSALQYKKDRGINVSLNMKASLGKWDEIGSVERWKEMGLWVANNIKFYNKELAISGELDAILKNPITGKHIGVEEKTFYGYPANRSICGIQREKGTGNRYNGRPKDEHFLQALLYYWEYQERLDEYRLYYLERGDGHRIEFRVGWETTPEGKHQVWWQQIPGEYWNAFSEEKVLQNYTMEDVHDRYRKLLELLRTRTLPDKDYKIVWDAEEIEFRRSLGEIANTKYTKWKKNPSLASNQMGAWQCSYCDYQKQCQSDGGNNS